MGVEDGKRYFIWWNGDEARPGCYVGEFGFVWWRREALVFDSMFQADEEISRRGWINTTDCSRPGTAYVTE